MFVGVYVCMRRCMCVGLCLCLIMCVCVSVDMRVCVHGVGMFLYTRLCVYVYGNGGVYVCVCA